MTHLSRCGRSGLGPLLALLTCTPGCDSSESAERPDAHVDAAVVDVGFWDCPACEPTFEGNYDVSPLRCADREVGVAYSDVEGTRVSFSARQMRPPTCAAAPLRPEAQEDSGGKVIHTGTYSKWFVAAQYEDSGAGLEMEWGSLPNSAYANFGRICRGKADSFRIVDDAANGQLTVYVDRFWTDDICADDARVDASFEICISHRAGCPSELDFEYTGY